MVFSAAGSSSSAELPVLDLDAGALVQLVAVANKARVVSLAPHRQEAAAVVLLTPFRQPRSGNSHVLFNTTVLSEMLQKTVIPGERG